MIEISEKQVSLIAQDNLVPAYLTIGGIQQEYRVTQIDSSFSSYEGRKFIAELEKVPMSESVLPTKVDTKEPKLKGYKLNPNYTPSAGDYFHIADWDYGEIEELVAMTPKSWWYNYERKIVNGFARESFILFLDRFGYIYEEDITECRNRITKGDILIPVEEVSVYKPENIVVTYNGSPFGFGNLKSSVLEFGKWLYPDISQPKKEKPELKYTELWMADTSKDVMGFMMGELTHGKYYEVAGITSNFKGEMVFKMVGDSGYMDTYHHNWFKPVRLYDEDESELICRDIEFVEGDYIDLRKHTPEQIRHIAQYYKFYDVSELLDDGDYIFAVFDGIDFDGTDSYIRTKGKQYTYDDIFYSEGN